MPGPFHHELLHRGPDLMAKLASLRITICGVGAVGSNLADNLVRQGLKTLRVIDHDRVESHNVSTQIYDEADVGVWKTEALRNHLFRANGVEIETVRKGFHAGTAGGLVKNCDLLVDAFDNTVSRQCVQDQARAAGVPCLHVGLHADYAEVIWDEHYRVPRQAADEAGVCDYALARNIVLLSSVVATEVILRWVSDGSRQNYSATLKDLAVRPME